MRNQYAGQCKDCGKHVPACSGNFERQNGRWAVRCLPCVAAGRQSAGKPLSHAQCDALRAPKP